MPVSYIPPSSASSYNDLRVLCIYLVAHRKNPVAAPSSSTPASTNENTNHWVIHLAISQNQSIRLDPSPGGDSNMTLIVSSKEYLYSNSAVKVIQLSTAANLTVGNVIDYIRQANYDRYQFAASGQGCRYWIYSTTTLLQHAGYVTDSSQVESATQALQRVWDTNGKQASKEQQSGITPGSFY